MKIKFIITIISILLTNIGCKDLGSRGGKNEIKADNITNIIEKSTKTNFACLNKTDSLDVKKFNTSLAKAIIEKNVDLITKHVSFPFSSDGETYTKEEFVLSYLDFVTSYFSKKMISSDEIDDLKREEYFLKKKNDPICFFFIISNSFPELEFNVDFYIDKIDGQLKIVKIFSSG